MMRGHCSRERQRYRWGGAACLEDRLQEEKTDVAVMSGTSVGLQIEPSLRKRHLRPVDFCLKRCRGLPEVVKCNYEEQRT